MRAMSGDGRETVKKSVTGIGNAKGRASKQEILEAASSLFGEVGFHEASLRDIAGRVGMTHPGLLHHFPTKKVLLAEVLAYRDEQDFAVMDQIMATEGMEFDQCMVEVARLNAARPGVVALYATLSAEATSAKHPAHGFFEARYTNLLTQLEEFYLGLGKTGRLREEVVPAIAAKTVMALMDGLQIQWLLSLATGNKMLDVDMSDVISHYIGTLRN